MWLSYNLTHHCMVRRFKPKDSTPHCIVRRFKPKHSTHHCMVRRFKPKDSTSSSNETFLPRFHSLWSLCFWVIRKCFFFTDSGWMMIVMNDDSHEQMIAWSKKNVKLLVYREEIFLGGHHCTFLEFQFVSD